MQRARRDMTLEAWERDNMSPMLQREMAPTPQVNFEDERMRHLEQVAFNLGIRTGVLAPAAPKPVEKPRLDDSQLRLAAMTAARAREGVAKQPRLEPLPVDKPKPLVAPRVTRTPLERANTPNKPKPILIGVDSNIEKMKTEARANVGRGFTPGLS
jgi:hypothetical protein